MRKKQIILINLALAIIFAIFFYGNYIGINLLIFELIALPIIIYINRPVKFNYLSITIFASVLISALMVVLLNTNWSIFINIILLITFSTVMTFQGFRSLINVLLESFIRIFSAQFSIFMNWNEVRTEVKKGGYGTRKIVYLIIVPAIILFLFVLLYASASSVFYQQFEGFFNAISEFLRKINFIFVLMIILGILIGNVLFMKTNPIGAYQADLESTDNLTRTKRKSGIPFKFTALKLENLSGIIILVLLNVLIFYFNILDIIHLWFGFEWDGSFLKEFVHEGTWVLVFTIFLSAIIALYFFRGNLNFLSNNKPLKALAILWISQNLIMTVSVIIRNYWYMQYFGLAYKRIAVIFFLALTIVGLITIIIKIVNKKTSFFLWKTNGYALLLVLVLSTCVNWDLRIAEFNFKHYDRSLLDYRFMASLSNSALQYTLKPYEELEEINNVQEKVMPFDIYQGYLWNIDQYYDAVQRKKDKFLKRYPHQNFLEWNLADYRTYKKLKEMGY